MGHRNLNLLLASTLGGLLCAGNAAATLTSTSLAKGLHSAVVRTDNFVRVGVAPPPPPPPPAAALTAQPTARTSSVMTALEHLGQVWEAPDPDRTGAGSLANRFKSLFDSAAQNNPGLAGQNVDQIVATVAGPAAVSALNAAYDKVRRAYAAQVAAEALPQWYESPQYRQLNEQREAVINDYKQRGEDTLKTRWAERSALTSQTEPAYLQGYTQRIAAQKDTHLEQLDELMTLGERYMVNFRHPPEDFSFSDRLMVGGYTAIESYEVKGYGDAVHRYNPRVSVVDYGEMGEQREEVLSLEAQRLDRVVGSKASYGTLQYHEFRMLGTERDLKVARLDAELKQSAEQFEAARRPQVEAAQKAYEDALAELDAVSQDLVARFDAGTDVEYSLDASVTAQLFDDVSSGCMMSVANNTKCGADISSEILDLAIEATDSKSGKFYQSLRKILAKPEGERTLNDKLALAGSIRDLFGDKAGGFGKIADGLLKGKGKIDDAVDLAKKIDSIINRDPNDPLAELKAFKTYLGLGQKFAGMVPGMGEMYEQYVQALDGIIENAKVISDATLSKNEAVDWVGDVFEGRYDNPQSKEEKLGMQVVNAALETLSELDERMLGGSIGGAWVANAEGERAVLDITKAERADYDEAREQYEKVAAQENKRMKVVVDSIPKLEEVLDRIQRQGGASAALAKSILGRQIRELRAETAPEKIGGYRGKSSEQIYISSSLNRNATVIRDGVQQTDFQELALKKASPGYNESVAKRIGEIAAMFPGDATMKKWVTFASGQQKDLVRLGKDLATATLIQAKAEKRLVEKVRRYTALALSNPAMRKKQA